MRWRTVFLVSLPLAALLLFLGCQPVPGENPFGEQEALAGQVVSTGCSTYSVSGCTESGRGHSVTFTYFGSQYNRSDQCGATYVYDWSCPSGTQAQACTSPGCGSGMECVNNYCISVAAPVVEICDNIDNDADGLVDEGCDDDNDNYCDQGMTFYDYKDNTTIATCTAGGRDCNDGLAYVSPGRAEVCYNSYDDNCNGRVNESCSYCFDSDSGTLVGGNTTTISFSSTGTWDGSYSISDSCWNVTYINESVCLSVGGSTGSRYGRKLFASSCVGGTPANATFPGNVTNSCYSPPGGAPAYCR